jgi:CrcB protein
VTPSLAVGIGGALGAALRVAIGDLATAEPWGWPIATLMANLAGTAVLAALAGVLVRVHADRPWVAFVGGGLCGALTTFSTLQVEVLRLARDAGPGVAAGYGLVSLAAGLAVALAAYGLASRLAARTAT